MTTRRPRSPLRAVALVLAVAALLALRPGEAPGDAQAAARPVTPETAPPKARSVRDSPGWYPSVDPESMSVVIGRRTNAPLVSKPFVGGSRSLDELGRAICRHLHHGSRDSLRGLSITADEFRDVMWREFPESRPATGTTWDFAWGMVDRRIRTGCADAVNEYGGGYLEFVRFESSEPPVRFKNFKVHRGLTLVVKNDRGQIERMTWLRSVAERKGVFKIFSLRD